MMQKPQKYTKVYYDYNECREYLEKKYGYDERDYLGKYPKNIKQKIRDVKYLDFWHWVIDHHDINNECFITFSQETLDEEYDMEDWQKEIYKRYLDEFADKNGELEMYVWW